MRLKSHASIFLFAGDTILNADDDLASIYERHQNEEDGLLYVTYYGENTMG